MIILDIHHPDFVLHSGFLAKDLHIQPRTLRILYTFIVFCWLKRSEWHWTVSRLYRVYTSSGEENNNVTGEEKKPSYQIFAFWLRKCLLIQSCNWETKAKAYILWCDKEIHCYVKLNCFSRVNDSVSARLIVH